MSLQAYSQARRVTEGPRDTEYRLFAEVTRELIRIKDKPRHEPGVMDALHRNRRLWSTLMSDCAREGNRLPEATRAAVISLAIWVDRYTSQVMRAGESVDALIDVNRTIMEGLGQRPAAA